MTVRGVEMTVRGRRAAAVTAFTLRQDLHEDADVQQLKQRRQNLMYQVAVLQLQRVSDGAAAAT